MCVNSMLPLSTNVCCNVTYKYKCVLLIQTCVSSMLKLNTNVTTQYKCVCVTTTGWRRLIGSPKLQIIFHKRATKYRSLLPKMTYTDKGSYESSAPSTCTCVEEPHTTSTCGYVVGPHMTTTCGYIHM